MNLTQARELQKDLEMLDRDENDYFDDEEFIITIKNYIEVR
jgi:hypothetical protein